MLSPVFWGLDCCCQQLLFSFFCQVITSHTAAFTRNNKATFLLVWIITESQNHRMVGVGRDLCGSSSPTPCQSRVTYSRLHRTLSRWILNISREGDSTAPLGSLGQGSITLRMKKFFLLFSWNFLCFSLCPLLLVLSLGTTEKNLAPSSWHPPFRYL